MQKRWVIRDADTEAVERLQQALNIPAALAMLLVQRGITTFEDARRFFRPSLEHLHDPFLMKDMDKAVDRILRALRSHEKILIYGDYDVDGTTSVALAYSFSKNSALTLITTFRTDTVKGTAFRCRELITLIPTDSNWSSHSIAE